MPPNPLQEDNVASAKLFTRNLLARGDAVERNSRLALQFAAQAVHRTLILRTPVGGPPTSPNDPHPGLARSNWRIFRGEVAAGLGIVPAVQLGVAIANGTRAIGALTVDDIVTITNSVPYIDKLNAGSSSQAPANFVDEAIFAGARATKNIALLKK